MAEDELKGRGQRGGCTDVWDDHRGQSAEDLCLESASDEI